MTAPVIEYGARAAHRPRPDGFLDDWSYAHTDPDHAMAVMASTGRIYWADISEFQKIVTAQYPWHQLAVRLDSGYRIDFHAKDNVNAWRKLKRGPLLGYGVFVPGQTKQIQQRLKNAFGSQPEFGFMDDMESGIGFAGPGNHSNEANDHAQWAAQWTGSHARSVGYANGGDWAHNWPSRPGWLKRVTAAYGTQDPGTWGWQYYGGLNYPTAAGFPRAVKPFGGWVDLNTAKLAPEAFAESLALDWLSMANPADLQAALVAALQSKDGQAAIVTALSSKDGQAAIDEVVRPFFKGSDGYAHVVETTVAHVTRGVEYGSKKGNKYPALAQK